MCEAVVIRQVKRNVVYSRALTQQITCPLQVSCDVRHHDPPGILLVENGRCIKAPAGILDACRSVRPAVTDQLVYAHQEMTVSFRLHIEWRRSKRRRVQPG